MFFNIEEDRFPLMIMTLHAYEAFTEMSEGAPMDMKHEAMWKALRERRGLTLLRKDGASKGTGALV